MKSLVIDPQFVETHLVEFIRRQMQETGFKNLVLGLSGGLDSALVCFLCARAVGPEHVLAVRMPYKSSSPASFEDAQKVIDATGVKTITLPVTGMVDALLEQVGTVSSLRRGNMMARARMIILFDQSAAFEALVVGTSNKTEILLGYSTWYGDSACSFNPIGGLYKTQVRQLSRAMGMPEALLAKAPTADLWEGQTDEGDLGFTYDEVDRLLFALVEEGKSVEECIALGFGESFVKKVVLRMQRFAFKRALPPMAVLP